MKLLNLVLGEIVFGGVGTGVSSLVMSALLVVFLAGLMVGRTPEYIGIPRLTTGRPRPR